MSDERQVVHVTYPPSSLARRVYGSVAAASKRLGIRQQTLYNYNRGMRLPFPVWQAMRQKNAKLVDRVTSGPPVQLHSGRGYKLPAKLTAEKAPILDTTQLSSRIEILEQENRTLRQLLAAVRAVVQGE